MLHGKRCRDEFSAYNGRWEVGGAALTERVFPKLRGRIDQRRRLVQGLEGQLS